MFCCCRVSGLVHTTVAVAGVSPLLRLVANRPAVPTPTGERDVPGFFLIVFVGRPVVDGLLIWSPQWGVQRWRSMRKVIQPFVRAGDQRLLGGGPLVLFIFSVAVSRVLPASLDEALRCFSTLSRESRRTRCRSATSCPTCSTYRACNQPDPRCCSPYTLHSCRSGRIHSIVRKR